MIFLGFYLSEIMFWAVDRIVGCFISVRLIYKKDIGWLMLGQWCNKGKKYKAFIHWKLSLDMDVAEGYFCERLHLNLCNFYFEACEQDKPVCLFDT